MLLKNVGLICAGCGAGRHYDCDLEVQKRNLETGKKMCVCFYQNHPYLSREQLVPPMEKLIVEAQVIRSVGTNEKEVERNRIR